MSDRTTESVGNEQNLYRQVDAGMPSFYDQDLGPVFFVDFADDIARRVVAADPLRVLEIAAGTGIVTRRLRDLLPAGSQLTATDLNPQMLDIARPKFRPDETVRFQPADATALQFPAASFDTVVCQFGIMFFPDKEKSYQEIHRVLATDGQCIFSVWDSHDYNPIGRVLTDLAAGFFPADPPRFFEERMPITGSTRSRMR